MSENTHSYAQGATESLTGSFAGARRKPGSTQSDDTNTDATRAKIRQRFFRERPLDSLPIKLTHERIYILPTGRGVMFLCGLLVMLITSMNYALGLGYALCFLLTGLFSAALLATYRNVQGITLTKANATRCSVGEPLVFNLQLENPNRSAARILSISDRQGHLAQIPCIAPDSSTSAQLQIKTSTRGWKTLGRLTLRSEYPVGLWFAWGYWHVEARELVLPASEPDAPSLPENQLTEESPDTDNKPQKTLSGDIRGIKPYQPGDNLAAIDWKSSSKGRGMHTREFEHAEIPHHIHLLWQDTAGLVDIEQRISRLAAWCRQCHAEERPFALHLPGQPTMDPTTRPQANSRGVDSTSTHNPQDPSVDAHLQQCLEALAVFDTTGDTPAVQAARERAS